MDVRSTMSCVRRVVPVPTLRAAFTDIDCFDVLVCGMPPEHDHAMLGPAFPRSNPLGGVDQPVGASSCCVLGVNGMIGITSRAVTISSTTP